MDMKHCFAVCAYKESPYLTACLTSLKEQVSPSPILVCTATPCDSIAQAAATFGASYHVNNAKPGISSDWNYAMQCAKDAGYDLVTLCHQDDLYLPDYGARMKKDAERYADLLIWFSDYGEQREYTDKPGERVDKSRLLTIKRVLLWRMRVKAWQASRFMKHRTLAIGDPICCPAVTFNLNKIPLPLFLDDMTTSLDWETWERLSLMDGRFAYDPTVQMLHRIHRGSTTTATLSAGGRVPEDYAMFRKFWPAPIARVLTGWYSKSEKSNQV